MIPESDAFPVESVRPRASVLRQLLEVRHRALVGSPRAIDAARRHERFMAQSDAYGVACQAAEDGPPGGERVVIGGLEWQLPPDARGGNAEKMLQRGWLPLTDILMSREFALGTAMIDIGANIGTTSIPRVVLGDFQYVYAAEPGPANYDCLVRNVLKNRLAGFVLPDRVAIGDVDEEASLRLSAKMTSHALERGPLAESDVAPHVTVRSMRLDTWVDALGINLHDVSFIKCDTQGWEGYILRGASEVLQRKHIVWQLEFWPKGLQKARFDRQELYALIRQHFTHFVDLSEDRDRRPKVRTTAELETALADVGAGARGLTDLVVYNSIG